MSGSRRSSNASTIEKKGTIMEPKKFKLSTKMKTFLRRGNLPLASITKVSPSVSLDF